jgi:hypothetical protein
MMRMCGGALMGRKEKEGLGRTGRWGKVGRGRRIWVADRFLGEEREKKGNFFWRMQGSLGDG